MRSLLIASIIAVSSSAMAFVPLPVSVPDTGATSLLLVAAMGSLVIGRRFFRR